MFYYLDSSRRPQGPYSREELEEMLKQGALTGETCVAAKGDEAWMPLRKLLHPESDTLPTQGGISMMEAYRRAFAGYAATNGRATRKEYWPFMVVFGTSWLILTFVFVTCLVAYAVSTTDALDFLADFDKKIIMGARLGLLILAVAMGGLVLLMAPGIITLQIRRLHDLGMRGWWAFVPLCLGVATCATVATEMMWPFLAAGSAEGRLAVLSALDRPLLLSFAVSVVAILILSMVDSQRGSNKYGPSSKYPET